MSLAELREAEKWLRDGHGSPRLKKAAELGLLKESLGIYRAERYGEGFDHLVPLVPRYPLVPRTGWSLVPRGWQLNAICNPSEAALDALAAERELVARRAIPYADLAFLREGAPSGGGCEVLVSMEQGEKIVRPIKKGETDEDR